MIYFVDWFKSKLIQNKFTEFASICSYIAAPNVELAFFSL